MGRGRRAMPKSWRWKIAERDGTDCGICGNPIRQVDRATLDHIVPRSLGGADTLANLRLAHFKCNAHRGVPKLDRAARIALRDGTVGEHDQEGGRDA